MTTLGKILVVVNLVFSIITGALIIMVFSVRTNWKSGFDKQGKYYEVSQANVRALSEELKSQKTQTDEKLKEKELALDTLTKQNKTLATNLDEAKGKNLSAVETSKTSTLTTDKITQENKRLQVEVGQLTDLVKKRDDKLVEVEKRNREYQDRYVNAEIALKSIQERLQKQIETNESLAREIERGKTGATVSPTGRLMGRKPPEDVKGIITKTDPTGLVTISIGSDAGISQGNVLEVYRLQPKPQYLGQIRVVDVRHNEAVGRPVTAPQQRAALLQQGDTVASDIQPKP